ncbi:YheC/YheD family endospore coat-associated protein [Syntrophomonas erecta]
MKKFQLIRIVSSSRLDTSTIMVSQSLAKQYNLIPGEKVRLSVGQVSKELRMLIRKLSEGADIVLNPATIRQLYIKSKTQLYGFTAQPGKIRIGPVVGIMSDVYQTPGKPFGGQSFFIRQLLTAGKQMGEICFAFSPQGVNWKRNNITGYTYGKNGWKKSSFPMPDVIYPRARAYTSSKQQIRRRLEKMGIKFLNSCLIGKWETHKIIRENPDLVPYIPDTRLVKSFQQVDRMINKYQAVYLKPVTGSQGKNIIKVTRSKNGKSYTYQYQLNNQPIKGSATSLSQLKNSLRRVMGNRTYIIQKQINLIRAEGNIIDVRIIVQKDHTGEWSVTGMACRIGRKGSITSNISAGGSGSKVETVLRKHFSNEEQRIDILKQLHFVSVEAAKTIEKSIGQCGEMGVDIGIDKNGKAWFIEANLRPARQVFNLIGEKDTRLRSVTKPMLYCRYLAHFE